MLPLELALSYLGCIQNYTLQHGVSVMMWQMFILKKFSSAASLMEKVGKAPKDRLCRKVINSVLINYSILRDGIKSIVMSLLCGLYFQKKKKISFCLNFLMKMYPFF